MFYRKIVKKSFENGVEKEYKEYKNKKSHIRRAQREKEESYRMYGQIEMQKKDLQ